MSNLNELIRSKIEQSLFLKKKLLESKQTIAKIEKVVNLIVSCYKQNGKVFLCGNGGSAADAQHLAAEFTGRFYLDRPPLFAEALHVNSSYLTAVANDYGYDEVFSRLVLAKCVKGDILICISTSGNSNNVCKALSQAKKLKVKTVSLIGENKGQMAVLSDVSIGVPSIDTPRVQEMHILVGHLICEMVEKIIFDGF